MDFLTSKFFLLLRLVLGAGLVLAALLVFIPAPTHLLWMVALAVTEWGHWLTVLALALLVLGGFGFSDRAQPSWIGLIGALLCLIAAFLTLTPVMQAVLSAKELPSGLERSFGKAELPRSGDAAPRATPLALTDLFMGVATPAIQPTSVIYNKAEGVDLALDLYKPSSIASSSKLRPVVLVIHGGSWQTGDKGEFAALNRFLAGRGYLVAAMNYRLAPKHKFPAAFEDVKHAIVYLKTHAADLGIDGDRLVLLGRSAGAQLAMLAGYVAGNSAVRGVISFYGPPDLRFSYTFPANPAVLDSRGAVESLSWIRSR